MQSDEVSGDGLRVGGGGVEGRVQHRVEHGLEHRLHQAESAAAASTAAAWAGLPPMVSEPSIGVAHHLLHARSEPEQDLVEHLQERAKVAIGLLADGGAA